jgi:nucleotide-binding universal stress UspA family protein
MHRFRNILVPIGGDPSRQSVLTQAARLAKQNGAAIKLIAVMEDLPWYTRLVLPTASTFGRMAWRSPPRSSGAVPTSR